jgi:hypothetical protein
MRRVLLLGFVLAATACGGKTFPSLCASQVPVPAECMVACNPTPNAADNCPGGFHCSGDGKCDTQCTATGGQCGADYSCTSDGRCVQNGSNPGGNDVDACPSAHVTAMKATPSVELLIDKSGSMAQNFTGGDPTKGAPGPYKFPTEQDALVGTVAPNLGIVTTLQASVYFGAAMFPSNNCPGVFSTPRKLNNLTDVSNLIGDPAHVPNGNTPTSQAIDAVVADFIANPPPKGSPPVILLSTDGLPNTCADNNVTQQAKTDTINAAKNAFAKGIRLYLLVVGNQIDAQFKQDLANAGQAVVAGQPNATAYTATDPASLAAAFQSIIGGILSCDLSLNGQVSAQAAPNGTVTLNNVVLTYGTDWNISGDGLTLHILGKSCDTLKNTMGATVDATFACGTVIF